MGNALRSVGRPLLPQSVRYTSLGTQLLGFHAGRGSSSRPSFGTAYGMHTPCLIVILLLIRRIYQTTSISIYTLQGNAVWHSLATPPELLAVFLFAISGLVPGKRGIVSRAHEHEKDSGVVDRSRSRAGAGVRRPSGWLPEFTHYTRG